LFQCLYFIEYIFIHYFAFITSVNLTQGNGQKSKLDLTSIPVSSRVLSGDRGW
jgi:hypothetical protein